MTGPQPCLVGYCATISVQGALWKLGNGSIEDIGLPAPAIFLLVSHVIRYIIVCLWKIYDLGLYSTQPSCGVEIVHTVHVINHQIIKCRMCFYSFLLMEVSSLVVLFVLVLVIFTLLPFVQRIIIASFSLCKCETESLGSGSLCEDLVAQTYVTWLEEYRIKLCRWTCGWEWKVKVIWIVIDACYVPCALVLNWCLLSGCRCWEIEARMSDEPVYQILLFLEIKFVHPLKSILLLPVILFLFFSLSYI